MNVLLLGSGGREHTIAWKIAQSKKLTNLYIAPGNAGTSQIGTNLDISATDFTQLKDKSIALNIDIVIVGPEDPLVKGIRDFYEADNDLKHIPVIGPNQAAAELEGSKEFAKEFMAKHNIPTAAYGSFTKETYQDACAFLDTMKSPYVLKADGLAAGKGVLIIDNLDEAKSALETMLNGQFGAASVKVVIEEFLDGIEVSYFALTDGENYVLLPEAKDYKRIGENDKGLNTGGMGAISPVPFADDVFKQKVIERIIEPTIKGLIKDKFDYTGFVFFGIISVKGEPMVIEYNVRMGDPETEVVIPRIETDLLELIAAIPAKAINNVPYSVSDKTAATVMLVSGGYPEAYKKGKVMTGFDKVDNSLLFHAGTTTEDNKTVTSGGRVLAITSFGKDKEDALAQSYKNAELIQFDDKNYRSDIGFDL